MTAPNSVELAKEKREKAIDVTCLPSYQNYAQGHPLPTKKMAYFISLAATGKLDLEQEYLSGNISHYFMNTKYWKLLEIPKNAKCKNPLKQTPGKLPTQFLETVVDSRFSPLLAESLERQGWIQTVL